MGPMTSTPRPTRLNCVLAAIALATAISGPGILGAKCRKAKMTISTAMPLVGFAAFGSFRYLVVAADSATAAILAGGLASIAPLGSERYVALASLVALLTAVFLLLARLLKLGFVADFLSQTGSYRGREKTPATVEETGITTIVTP